MPIDPSELVAALMPQFNPALSQESAPQGPSSPEEYKEWLLPVEWTPEALADHILTGGNQMTIYHISSLSERVTTVMPGVNFTPDAPPGVFGCGNVSRTWEYTFPASVIEFVEFLNQTQTRPFVLYEVAHENGEFLAFFYHFERVGTPECGFDETTWCDKETLEEFLEGAMARSP